MSNWSVFGMEDKGRAVSKKLSEWPHDWHDFDSSEDALAGGKQGISVFKLVIPDRRKNFRGPKVSYVAVSWAKCESKYSFVKAPPMREERLLLQSL